MSEDTAQELQDHILECSQNYGDLKNEVSLQNQKIDTLAEKVNDIYHFLTGMVVYSVAGLFGVCTYLLEHYVLK
ncbi:hypothetical protein AB4Y36_03515 [Paraburkholderia sp. BR10936]|uniref:hypothetical protein n=1 Tax=Paraburkholderia sp. BR10936 TaxID=3236993 RepID=UPI0034D1BFC6